MGIREMLRRALAKLVLRAVGHQAKTPCGNPQMCTVLEASIEGLNHSVGNIRRDMGAGLVGEEVGGKLKYGMGAEMT